MESRTRQGTRLRLLLPVPAASVAQTSVFLILLFSVSVWCAVDLSWFEVRSGRRINLSWKTGSEVDVSGFFVRRSERNAQPKEKCPRIEVTDKTGRSTLYISPGLDSVAGSTYEYWDPATQEGKTYYYLLEIVDKNGDSEFYGPVKAVRGKTSKMRAGGRAS